MSIRLITRQVSAEHLLSTTRGCRRAGGEQEEHEKEDEAVAFFARGKAIGFVRDLALFFHAVIEVTSRGGR